MQRLPDLPRDHRRRRPGRARDRRRHLLQGRAGARAHREPEVRPGARPLQGRRARRGPPPLAPGLRRPAEDRRGAAAAPGLHLRHHRDRRRAGDDPLALPGVPLPARLDAERRRHLRHDLRRRRRSRRATRRSRCSRAPARAACATPSRCSTSWRPSATARSTKTRPSACSAASTSRSFSRLLAAILAGDSPGVSRLAREVEENGWDPRRSTRTSSPSAATRSTSRSASERRSARPPRRGAQALASDRRSAPATRICFASSTSCSAARAPIRRSEAGALALEIAWLRAAELPKLVAIEECLAGSSPARRAATSQRRAARSPRRCRRARRRHRARAARAAAPIAPIARRPQRPLPPAGARRQRPARRPRPASPPFSKQLVLRRPTLAAQLAEPATLAGRSGAAALWRSRPDDELAAISLARPTTASCSTAAADRRLRSPAPAAASRAPAAAAPAPAPPADGRRRARAPRPASIRACRRCSRSSAARSLASTSSAATVRRASDAARTTTVRQRGALR